MKAIFLDFDGVLNSDEYFNSNLYLNNTKLTPLNELDPSAIRKINKIINTSGALVVASTSWRLNPDFETVFKNSGIDSKLYGITPSIYGRRGKEISTYLREHPEIKEYVIIDDNDYNDPELESEPLKYHFVKTKYYTGITDKDVEKALLILNSIDIVKDDESIIYIHKTNDSSNIGTVIANYELDLENTPTIKKNKN